MAIRPNLSLYQNMDQLDSDVFDRDGRELNSAGLYLDMRPWQAAV